MLPADPSGRSNCHKQDGQIVTIIMRPMKHAWLKNLGSNRMADIMSCGHKMSVVQLSQCLNVLVEVSQCLFRGWTNDQRTIRSGMGIVDSSRSGSGPPVVHYFCNFSFNFILNQL